MKQVCNEQGLCLDIVREVIEDVNPDKHHNLLGGDDRNPTWEEYLADYKEEYQPYILLIKKSIEENGMVGGTGSRYANDTIFKFSDGNIFTFSWRAWGDLMQAIVDKKEGYIAYYM